MLHIHVHMHDANMWYLDSEQCLIDFTVALSFIHILNIQVVNSHRKFHAVNILGGE